MDEHCCYAKVHVKIDCEVQIAPIQLHYLLGHLTTILKETSELERVGHNRKISMDIGVKYLPVVDDKAGESS